MARVLLVCWVFLASFVLASAQLLTPAPSPVVSAVADAHPVASAVIGQSVEVNFLVGLKGESFTRDFYDLPIGVRPLDTRIGCDYRVGGCVVTSATPGHVALFVTPLGGDKDVPYPGSRVTINFVPEPRVGTEVPLVTSTSQGEVGDMVTVDAIIPVNIPWPVVLEVVGGETFNFPGGISFGQRIRVWEEVVTPFSLPGTGVVEVRLTSSHGRMLGLAAYSIRTNTRPAPEAELVSEQIRVQGLLASGLYHLALVRGPRFFLPLGEARVDGGGELVWNFAQLGYQVELPEGVYTLLVTHEQGESHTVRLHLPQAR